MCSYPPPCLHTCQAEGVSKVPWLNAWLNAMLTHVFWGVTGSTNNPLAWHLCILFGIKKKDRKTEGSKTLKNAKMSLQGSKNTSKTEPKVVSGHGFFDFDQALISGNTTVVLLDFHGFRVPRGGQKTIKKRCRKRNVEKDGAKPFFYKKMWKVTVVIPQN